MYGGDELYGKLGLLWPLVVFGHADLHSRTDSQVLRAEYCIVGIPQYSHLVLLFFSLELMMLVVYLVVYNFITGESVEYFEISWDWIVVECSLV